MGNYARKQEFPIRAIRFPDSFLKAYNAHDTEADAVVRTIGERQTLR
jgi:hypothetical protein